MPVTPKQLEQIRRLGRESRDKQDAFIQKWRAEQQRVEKMKADINEKQKAAGIGTGLGTRE